MARPLIEKKIFMCNMYSIISFSTAYSWFTWLWYLSKCWSIKFCPHTTTTSKFTWLPVSTARKSRMSSMALRSWTDLSLGGLTASLGGLTAASRLTTSSRELEHRTKTNWCVAFKKAELGDKKPEHTDIHTYIQMGTYIHTYILLQNRSIWAPYFFKVSFRFKLFLSEFFFRKWPP